MGRAAVLLVRRGNTFLLPVLLLLVSGGKLEIPRERSASAGSAMSGQPDVKAMPHHGACVSFLYADAQKKWEADSQETDLESAYSETGASVIPQPRRGPASGGKKQEPFYKKHAKLLTAAAAVGSALLIALGAYKYKSGAPEPGKKEAEPKPGNKGEGAGAS